VDIEIA